MDTHCVSRDNFGMYARNNDGPGPSLMGANTLLGNDVYNAEGEDLGDIKEFMLDMASGRVKTRARGVHKFYGTPYSGD